MLHGPAGDGRGPDAVRPCRGPDREEHRSPRLSVRDAAILAGGALQQSPTATSVRGQGAILTDAAFLAVKEQLGGFYRLELADLDVALELAKLVPAPFGGVSCVP